MAKFSAHGATKVAAFETPNGNRRYTLMTNGRILRQLRIDGKLGGPAIARAWNRTFAAKDIPAFRNWCAKFDATVAVEGK